MPVLRILRLIKRGNVNSAELGQAHKGLVAGKLLTFGFDKNANHEGGHLLTVAHNHRVHNGCDWFGIDGARASADDKRHIFASLACKEGQPRKLQHGQNVAVTHLIQKRKTYYIEFTQGAFCLKRKERQLGFSKLRFHIRPRRKHTLAVYLVHVIQHMIKYARS